MQQQSAQNQQTRAPPEKQYVRQRNSSQCYLHNCSK